MKNQDSFNIKYGIRIMLSMKDIIAKEDRAFCADNFGLGQMQLMRVIDKFLGEVLSLQTEVYKLTENVKTERKITDDFSDLLGGYYPYEINGGREKKLKEMVNQWKKEDGEEVETD